MRVLSRVDKFLELKNSNSMQNEDIVPIPVPRRRWGYVGFISYWAILNLCAVTWSTGSSLLSVGLNGAHTLGIIVIGNALICVVSICNAVYGSEYHIGFSVFQRVVFGIRGSYYGVVIRSILSVVWFASQSWLGGLCMNLIISSWSKSYLNMRNHFPESVKMTSQELIGFVLYLIVSVPCLMIPPEYFDFLLTLGSTSIFFAGMGITIWAVKQNDGNYGKLMNQPIELTGTEIGWAWMYGINSWYSSLVAGVANQSDFSRFNTKPIHFYLGTAIGNTFSGIIVPLFGILSASALNEKFDVDLWMPNDIGMFWLHDEYSSARRAGAFFTGLALVVSQLSVNAIGNAISGGMDLSSIFPRYINIRRGALIILILAWPTQPWLFYNSSSTFLTVMSSFSVFITPMVAVYVCEYFVIRKRILKLSDCYVNSSKSVYWYNHGINWVAIVACIAGCAPGLPGLITAANPSIHVSKGIIHFYEGSFAFQFVITFLIYWGLSLLHKVDIGSRDEIDYFHTFTESECINYNTVQYDGQTFENEKEEYKILVIHSVEEKVDFSD